MNTIIKSLLIASLLLISHATSAISVFTDFDGDMAHDAIYNALPGTHTASVYVELDLAEIATHGGLGGFGVHFNGNGLAITGNNDVEKSASIGIDAQWSFVPSKTITRFDSADVVGNTLAFPGFTTTPLHLFDISLEISGGAASYLVQLSNIAGDSFVADDFFVYDPTIIFEQSQINVVPIPAGIWLFLTGLIIPFFKIVRKTNL